MISFFLNCYGFFYCTAQSSLAPLRWLLFFPVLSVDSYRLAYEHFGFLDKRLFYIPYVSFLLGLCYYCSFLFHNHDYINILSGVLLFSMIPLPHHWTMDTVNNFIELNLNIPFFLTILFTFWNLFVLLSLGDFSHLHFNLLLPFLFPLQKWLFYRPYASSLTFVLDAFLYQLRWFGYVPVVFYFVSPFNRYYQIMSYILLIFVLLLFLSQFFRKEIRKTD